MSKAFDVIVHSAELLVVFSKYDLLLDKRGSSLPLSFEQENKMANNRKSKYDLQTYLCIQNRQ